MLSMDSAISYHERKWEYPLNEISAEILRLRAEIAALKEALASVQTGASLRVAA